MVNHKVNPKIYIINIFSRIYKFWLFEKALNLYPSVNFFQEVRT